MPRDRASLLAGRNRRPLSDDEITRVTNTFLGMDREANTRYDGNGNTRFRTFEDDGEIGHEIVFCSDIYPGTSVVDPNSSLSMRAAAAHELSHYHRWRDITELMVITCCTSMRR
jgi:hypothetical protein